MRNIVEYSKFLARELMGVEINVRIVHTTNKFLACYGNRAGWTSISAPRSPVV